MAKNREPEKPAESQSESGGEEEEDASSEEVDSQESGSEEELQLTQVSKKAPVSTLASQKKAPPPTSKTPQQAQTHSSSDEETGSESESESDEPDPNVRPIASKPMDDPQKSNNAARKPRSKPNSAEPATPTKSAVGKRTADGGETEAKDAKKAKKKPEGETSEKKSNDDTKKLLFQRLWSEEDEIVILKGMIDYASKKKADPVADLNAFHEFIKKNLHVDVTRTQLQDKIRRLRKKYENNKSKEKDGKERTFSKPHEQKAYELSKFVWGNENGKENTGEKVLGSPKANGSAARRTASKKVNAADNEAVKDAKSSEVVEVVSGEKEKLLPSKRLNSDGATVEERIIKAGAELFETGNGLEGEKVWKKLRVDEIEVYLRQLEVKAAQTRLVLDVLKSSEG